MFICVHIPDLPVEALLRLEPDLRQQAIAVVQGVTPIVTVVASNDRARAVGVGPGMTGMQAEERLRLTCEPKRWSVRPRSIEQETSASAALFDCVCAFSSRVEQTAPDTVTAEIAGSEQFLGSPRKLRRTWRGDAQKQDCMRMLRLLQILIQPFMQRADIRESP